MKKTYIEPKNTVVRLNTETLIAASADPTQTFNDETPAAIDGGGYVDMEAREVIRSRDAWEEW